MHHDRHLSLPCVSASRQRIARRSTPLCLTSLLPIAIAMVSGMTGCAGSGCMQPQYPAGYPQQYPAYPAYPQPYPTAAGAPAVGGVPATAMPPTLPAGYPPTGMAQPPLYGQPPAVSQPPLYGQPPVYGQPIPGSVPGTTSAGYPPGYAQPMFGK